MSLFNFLTRAALPWWASWPINSAVGKAKAESRRRRRTRKRPTRTKKSKEKSS